MFIGLTGKRGSGKTTIAEFLEDKYLFTRLSFADKLKECAMMIYDLNHEQLYGHLKDIEDERYFMTPRYILQRLGTEVVRSIHNDSWIWAIAPEVVYLLDEEIDIVIDDVRFDNEAKWIKSHGGKIIQVNRNTLINDAHASEHGIDTSLIDMVYVNSGDSLEQLYSGIETTIIPHFSI